jgi:hypothetical protein
MVMVLRGNTAADLPEKSILHLVIYPIDSLFCSFFSFLFPSSLFFSCDSFFFSNCLPFISIVSSFYFLFDLSFFPSITASPSEQPHRKKKPLGCHAGACVTAGLH